MTNLTHEQKALLREFRSDLPDILAGRDKPPAPQPHPSVDTIIRAVSRVTGCPVDDLLGERRGGPVRPVARQMAAYMVRALYPAMTQERMAQHFHKDPRTVAYQASKGASRLGTDTCFRSLFERVNGALGFPLED